MCDIIFARDFLQVEKRKVSSQLMPITIKTTSYLLPFLYLLLLPFLGAAQDYYWSNNNKIMLVRDNKVFLVRAPEKSEIESNITTDAIASVNRINKNSILIRMEPSQKPMSDLLILIHDNRISSFKTVGGQAMIPTGEILFKPKNHVGFERVNELAGGQLDRVSERYGTYRVFVKEYNDLLQIANRIYESGLVEYSHPNFIMGIVKLQNDPLYPDQYYLNNTGQFEGTNGVDINAPQAWTISTGVMKRIESLLNNPSHTLVLISRRYDSRVIASSWQTSARRSTTTRIEA